MKNIIFSFVFIFASFLTHCLAGDYYVSTSGDDSASGAIDKPWRTIQHAADTVSAGDTVFIHGGTYEERVNINVSGTESGGYITFQNVDGETVYLDGTNLSPPEDASAMLRIENQHHIIIQGLETKNYATSDGSRVVMGIFITGSSHHIKLLDNYVHHIAQNTTSSNGDAHAIAVYGTNGSASINNLVIEGNTISDCKLGSSEALVLNGNVESFEVSNNIVHDCNNIGIDLIGWENTAPANDQARDGTVSGNTVYNITSYGNPAYGTDRSAAGIYVDGGRDIVIERNTVHHCDFGVEVASEHSGKTTSGIVVRDNILYLNNVAGITFGGYDSKRGVTIDCVFLHNTLYQNDTTKSQNGEIMIQKAHENVISDNIIHSNNQNILISNYFDSGDSYDNTFDYNLYYAPAGSDSCVFIWQDQEFEGFSAYKTGSSQDSNSLFGDPLFVNTSATPPNFQLQATSPAINAGNPSFVSSAGETDYAGNNRVMDGRTDCGAYEYTPSGITYTVTATVSPANSGTVNGSGVYIENATATLQAVAADGYEFSEWSGDLSGTNNPATLIIDSNKNVTANFIESTTIVDHVSIGAVISVEASEVDSSLSEFTKKPILYATYDNDESNAKLRVVNTPPFETALAEWTKKLPLYEKADYKGYLLSDRLSDNPLKALQMDGLYITVKEKNADFEVYDKKLSRSVSLEPPVITGISGDFGRENGVFTVSGMYFGSKPPKILVEYLKNGDQDSPKYKNCKIDKKKTTRFKNAKGKSGKSCMVVQESDVSETTPLGYSEVVAAYPKLKNTDKPTGFIIVDNRIGLAVYEAP